MIERCQVLKKAPFSLTTNPLFSLKRRALGNRRRVGGNRAGAQMYGTVSSRSAETNDHRNTSNAIMAL